MKNHICVGGPLGGQRKAVMEGSRFRIALNHWPTSSRAPFTEADMQEKVQVDIAVYIEERMHTPQGELFFWVPEGQTPRQTMEILVAGYCVSCLTHYDDDEED